MVKTKIMEREKNNLDVKLLYFFSKYIC